MGATSRASDVGRRSSLGGGSPIGPGGGPSRPATPDPPLTGHTRDQCDQVPTAQRPMLSGSGVAAQRPAPPGTTDIAARRVALPGARGSRRMTSATGCGAGDRISRCAARPAPGPSELCGSPRLVRPKHMRPIREVLDGPLGRWAAGPLGRWAAGPLGRWAAGPLGRWAAGPLGRWAAGPHSRSGVPRSPSTLSVFALHHSSVRSGFRSLSVSLLSPASALCLSVSSLPPGRLWLSMVRPSCRSSGSPGRAVFPANEREARFSPGFRHDHLIE